ncbi:hypothetical protein [Flavobacterium sp.]|uniref:hypothetical protein n=1 Tax=Flavobacterium sp. TaxID=239 RepID=UPI0039E2C6B9
MKRTASIFLFLCCAVSFAQTLETLKPLAKKIHEANYNMDFEPLADLTYPNIVEQLGGRQKFLEKVDSDYQNDAFRKRIQIENPTFQYSEIKQIEGKSYCVVSYYNPIRYFIENKLDATTGPQKAAELKQIERATSTIYEPNRNTVNVKRNSKLVAIADESTQNQWKFINLDDATQRELADKLLNESIKKQLGL